MDSHSVPDEELIYRFLGGSSDSFETLISRYEGKVYRLAMRLMKNEQDAEEVLQDAFITVYRKLSTFKGNSAFSTWLYRITVNAALMKLRKSKREPMTCTDEVVQEVLEGIVAERDYATKTDSRATAKELRRALERAIERLPEDYRVVFLLRDVDGLSNKEVAEVLDTTIPAVKAKLHRSRFLLRRRLKPCYDLVRRDKDFVIPLRGSSHSWTAV